MKCPKCHSEVAGQPVCPYCGAAVLQDSEPMAMPAGESKVDLLRDVNRRLRKLETRVNLLLVLLTATFALAVLTLAVLALK